MSQFGPEDLNNLVVVRFYNPEFKQLANGKWQCTLKDSTTNLPLKTITQDSPLELLLALKASGLHIAKKVDPESET